MAKLIFAAAITLLLSALLVDAATTSATATAKVTETACTDGSTTCKDTFTNAECVSSLCACSDNYELANKDTECKLSAGQICDDDDECASDDCFGSTGNTPGLCNSAPVAVTASIVLMFFTFLTSRFF